MLYAKPFYADPGMGILGTIVMIKMLPKQASEENPISHTVLIIQVGLNRGGCGIFGWMNLFLISRIPLISYFPFAPSLLVITFSVYTSHTRS